MLWILRRTRGGLNSAATLLNNFNNNSSQRASESRPARKNYNKLPAKDDNKQRSEESSILDNESSLDEESSNTNNGNSRGYLDSDSESSYADYDLDEREEFSDDSDYDEALTCNVCDRSFAYPKQLSSHKQKKRHFGCSACDSLFPSLMALEHHKEEFEHWSGDEDDILSESEDDTAISEECERLL